VFHADVAKVDRDVTYVAIVVHVCYKISFLMFHLFFPDIRCKRVYSDVAYVSHTCCSFYLDVVYVLQWFIFKCFHVFLLVFQMHFSSVSSVFRRILQVLHLDVSKVD
jgi:hypothetical protein